MKVVERAIVFIAFVGLVCITAPAQESPSPWRTIRGVVVDKLGHPVVRATVYLRDADGHRLRMRQTDRVGKFTFGLVNLGTDREIYAEQHGSISNKVIVSLGGRGDVAIKLTLDSHAGSQ